MGSCDLGPEITCQDEVHVPWTWGSELIRRKQSYLVNMNYELHTHLIEKFYYRLELPKMFEKTVFQLWMIELFL